VALSQSGGKLPQEQARDLVDKLAGGQWTHDYGLTAQQGAKSLGLNVTTGYCWVDPRADAAIPAGEAVAID
jgi:hypothetical protein